MNPAPPKRAWKLRAALQALAERGVNGERANAVEKLAALESRYDFQQAEIHSADLFAGVFKARPGFRQSIGTVTSLDSAASIKWAIEARTGIACSLSGSEILAEATNGTVRTLAGIVSTLAPAFGRLWQEWERAGGLSGDWFCFMQGLYDGMMLETRASGQALPSRGVAPKRKRGVRQGAITPALGVHPYSVATAAGRQLRFMVPIDQVERDLKDAVKGQIQ